MGAAATIRLSRSSRLFAAALGAAALAVAAAGCDDASTGGGGEATVTGGRIAIVLTEYEIKPDDIAAEPGEVTFVVRNEGKLAHNLKLRRGGIVVAGSSTIQGGTTSFHALLQPGRYRIVCSVAGHSALGMRGRIVVR